MDGLEVGFLILFRFVIALGNRFSDGNVRLSLLLLVLLVILFLLSELLVNWKVVGSRLSMP